MTVLVTGGAGYIGSHATKQLVEAGRDVVVIDSLVKGHRDAVHEGAALVELDLRETAEVERVLRERAVDAVMHFAAFIEVGESVGDPLKYWSNNVGASMSLLRAMAATGVKRLVFSSTCATYGVPDRTPIAEDCPQRPINPYGRTKLVIEQLLRDVAAADPEFGAVALRYFNVAGVAADGSLGERHEPESHLVPLIFQVALGERPALKIFGTDYPTRDGTCVRDYLHVDDLCAAHLLALDRLGPGFDAYNLGLGHGWTVREVLDAARRVTGIDFPTHEVSRRPGDPPVLYADPTRARDALGWTPRYDDLDEVIATAWRWLTAHRPA